MDIAAGNFGWIEAICSDVLRQERGTDAAAQAFDEILPNLDSSSGCMQPAADAFSSLA
jgi:hypothetical protein